MVIDNHVHIGWFTDKYHSPKEVWYSATAAGINGMAVASTSTCTELYKNVRREFKELIRLGGSRVHPILWITPRMMKIRYPLPYMLHSKIKWEGIKLHFEAHLEWAKNEPLLNKALNVAKSLNVPVLLHTGDREVCHAGLFEDIIKRNSDLIFVLAHGRPIDETIDVLRKCPNTYVDTAFMPENNLRLLIDNGLTDRILFGTDTPINEVYYNDITTSAYIAQRVKMLYDVVGDEAERILSRCIYHSSKEPY